MTSRRLFAHAGFGRFGQLAGRLAYALLPDRRRIVRRNLGLAFPEAAPEELEPLARRTFGHAGAAMLESFSVARLPAEEICRLLAFESWQHFAEADDSGRGVIVLTAHLGVHEVVGPVVALYRGPMHVVARPLAHAGLERRARRIRERFGNRTILKRSAARGMLRALGEHGRVAILIDQRVHPNQGVRVPFFGRRSWTSPLPAQLSLRSGAPVLPIFVYREPSSSYRVVAHPPIHPPEGGGETRSRPDPAAVEALTARYAAATESAIRRRPWQWLWMHDRWRRH